MLNELQPKLSIVIPVYNEESALPSLFVALSVLLDRVGQISTEVLFVDDHSSDESPALLRNACQQDDRFRYLRLARNSGSHVAILAGLEHTRGTCAVFLAADLQDPPELITDLLRLWREGHQVVWAVRAQREGLSCRQKLLANAFYWLLNRFSEVQLPPAGADFALLDRTVINALLSSVGADPSLGADIASLGFGQTELKYTKNAREFGTSKWTLARRLKAFADAFVGHSFAPIRFMSYAGITVALLGFLYAIVIVYLRLTSALPIDGWASLMVLTLAIGGLQMTMLGVLGEYLCRALRETRRRPRYFIEQDTEADAGECESERFRLLQEPADPELHRSSPR